MGARDTILELQHRIKTYEEPVAVIGIACLFPSGATEDAASMEALHTVLSDGVDCVRAIPAERKKLYEHGHYNDGALPMVPGIAHAAFLERNLHAFDSSFFNMPPAESRMTDPQHRLMLELPGRRLLMRALRLRRLPNHSQGFSQGRGGMNIWRTYSEKTRFPLMIPTP